MNFVKLCDINNFFLFIHMNIWIAGKDLMKILHSSLSMEYIAHTDYRHSKKVFRNFNDQNLGDYHDLYVQSDTLLLTDVFENFRNKFIEIYELEPAHFLSATGFGMTRMFRANRNKIRIIN